MASEHTGLVVGGKKREKKLVYPGDRIRASARDCLTDRPYPHCPRTATRPYRTRTRIHAVSAPEPASSTGPVTLG